MRVRCLLFVILVLLPALAWSADLACTITVSDDMFLILQEHFGGTTLAPQEVVEQRLRTRLQAQVNGILRERVASDASKVVDKFQSGTPQQRTTIRQGLSQLLR